MGCGCGAKKANVAVAQPVNVTTQPVVTQCDITADTLNKWFSILQCVKNNNSYQKTGVSEITVNQYTGILQSALNYPDNYCYYSAQLNVFKDTILIKIIENEPICI